MGEEGSLRLSGGAWSASDASTPVLDDSASSDLDSLDDTHRANTVTMETPLRRGDTVTMETQLRRGDTVTMETQQQTEV